MADREKREEDGNKKNEDLNNENNFLDEISIFHNYLRGFQWIFCVQAINHPCKKFFSKIAQVISPP